MTQSDAGVASLTPTKITPVELDAFSAAQVQGSFQQTSQMAAMGAFNGPVDYVGVKRGDKLIAACYVVYTQSRFGLEGSVWCGPLCDYDNPQVVEAMTEALRRSAKAHHAKRIRRICSIRSRAHLVVTCALFLCPCSPLFVSDAAACALLRIHRSAVRPPAA